RRCWWRWPPRNSPANVQTARGKQHSARAWRSSCETTRVRHNADSADRGPTRATASPVLLWVVRPPCPRPSGRTLLTSGAANVEEQQDHDEQLQDIVEDVSPRARHDRLEPDLGKIDRQREQQRNVCTNERPLLCQKQAHAKDDSGERQDDLRGGGMAQL